MQPKDNGNQMSINKYVNRLRDFDSRWWYTGYHVDFLLLDFEVAPIEYRVRLTHDEAIMYCFSLNIDGKVGWRLPTQDEIDRAGLEWGEVYVTCASSKPWDITRSYVVRPVRDIGKYSFKRKLLCKLLNLVYSKKS